MAHLDKTGPDGKGAKTGRQLGNCKESDNSELLNKLGKGLGLRRRSGGGTGQGKRLKSHQL